MHYAYMSYQKVESIPIISKCQVFLSFFHLIFTGSPTPLDNEYGVTPLAGHSLSWSHEKHSQPGPNGTMVAKVWTPEDPRQSSSSSSPMSTGSSSSSEHFSPSGSYDYDELEGVTTLAGLTIAQQLTPIHHHLEERCH